MRRGSPEGRPGDLPGGGAGTKSGLVAAFILLVACATGHTPAGPGGSEVRRPEDIRVWREFVDLLRAGPFPDGRVIPYQEDLRQPMLGFLAAMRAGADWREWRRDPEVVRSEDRLHFLLPLTFDGRTANYCFSFTVREGAWYFQHLEAIVLRLDRIGPLPASAFPDLPEGDKAWIRAELEVSRDVWMFGAIAAEKGRAAALAWFSDGAGYALAARAWVPFVSPARAFVLYLCWEQSNLRGGEVVLERLDDDRAVVRLRPLHLALYERTAHLRRQITPEDYRALFELRWRERARSAGWDLAMTCQGEECVFTLSRRTTPEPAAGPGDGAPR